MIAVRSPSNEFWSTSYEVPAPDVEPASQPVEIEFGKGISYDDLSSDVGSPAPPQVAPPPLQVPLPPKQETVCLGKMIRESTQSSSVRSRDRRRERSVLRARDCLFASKRRTSGLPPDFRAPARDSFQVPKLAPPPRHAGAYRNSGSRLLSPQPRHAVNHCTDTASSVNRSYMHDSIKVSVVYVTPALIYCKFLGLFLLISLLDLTKFLSFLL